MPDAAEAPTFRRAVAGDADELARLRWEFSVELDRADEDLPSFTERFRQSVADFLTSGRWTIWVAELRERRIGTVWVERVDKVPRPYERPMHWGYVTNVYVAPAYRDRGIGRRMLDGAIAEAREAGWELLLLWPSERSGTFYARARFQGGTGALELDLADPEEGNA